MEACLPNIKPRTFSSPISTSKTKIPPVLLLPPDHRRVHGRFRWLTEVKCGGRGRSVPELERKLGEELAGMGRFRDEKCSEVNGVAELLECLEREAIMGEDEGREPTDYNRRAQIFDKSSRMFQALKENSNSNEILDPSPPEKKQEK